MLVCRTGSIRQLYDTEAVFIVAGGTFRLFWIMAVGVVIFFRFCSKNIYGVPYTAPFAPVTLKSIIRDTFAEKAGRSCPIRI